MDNPTGVLQFYGLTQSVAPTVEPLTLAEVKRHLRIDHTDDDVYINDYLIKAAREHVEDVTERQLITATWVLKLPDFPCEGEPLKLPRPPLLTVSSITYYVDSVSTTWSSTAYSVLTTETPGVVEESTEDSWPDADKRRDAVTVTYTAGYGAAASAVPLKIKQAMLLLVGNWYEHREAADLVVAKPIEFGVDSLLKPYQVRIV